MLVTGLVRRVLKKGKATIPEVEQCADILLPRRAKDTSRAASETIKDLEQSDQWHDYCDEFDDLYIQ